MPQYYTDEHLKALVLCVGRTDTYALLRDGAYWRESVPLTFDVLAQHVEGSLRVASYVVAESGLCRFAVFRASGKSGVTQLIDLQRKLREVGVPSYLESGFRFFHLWLFLEAWCTPMLLWRALLPYASADVRLFPVQQDDVPSWERPGSLMLLPLGLYSNGKRYPFVEYKEDRLVPYAPTSVDTLSWLLTVQRVKLSSLACLAVVDKRRQERAVDQAVSGPEWVGIREWNAQQDHFKVIGRYVELDQRGLGYCPFASSHSGGKFGRCFKVYDPSVLGGRCWYCYACNRGGSVFDFLALYHGLEKRELVRRIRAGEQF